MSEAQKYLPEGVQQEKAKSEHGDSTNLSEPSNEVDEEFKVDQKEKFEFINEQAEDWPQWSVEEKKKQA